MAGNEQAREETVLHRFGCGVLLIDRKGKLTFANASARRMLEIGDEDLLRHQGKTFSWHTLDKEGRPLTADEHPFTRILAGESILAEEYLFRSDNGSERILLINGNPLRREGNAIDGGIIDLNDVTEKNRLSEKLRRAKAAVEKKEARLQALIGSMDDIVFELDTEGTYLNIWTVNESLLKRPRQELLGRKVEEFLEPELSAPFLQTLRRIAESGEAETMEYPLEVLGGQRWFLARVAPIPHNCGDPPTLAFFARDITDRKQMEEELRVSERRFHQVLANVQLAAVILDPRGRIVFCNDFLLGLTGWTREEIEGRDWFDVFIPQPAREARKRWLESIIRNGSGYHEEEILTRQGLRRLLGWNTLVVRNGRGNPVGCASIAEDITERRQATEVLRRSDSMKSEFVSTAAHELRTPLTTIMGYAELLLNAEQYGGFSDQQRLDFLKEIYAKGEILTEIINDLLDLSRLEAGAELPLHLSSCVVEELLEREVKRYRELYPHHRFELALEESCPRNILIDRERIREVLENLLSNAAKYSPPGGVVWIRGGRSDGAYVVSVRDEGIGMTADQVEHIFDKFYRADASDTAIGGLGLGMSLARSIVQAHGGRIWVHSEPGRGTCVFFSLFPPRSHAEEVHLPPP